MADLARLAGVSAITVSRALAGSPLVNPETATRIKAIAEAQGYTFNVSARNLRLRSNRTVAVIVEMKPSPDRRMSDPYPLDLLGGISQELASAGYCVLLSTRAGGDVAAVRGADAVILLGQGAHEDAVAAVARWRLPMVVWGAPLPGAAQVTVGSDNRRGGALAAERFLALGRHRIGFLGDTAHAEVAARLAGFEAVLSAHGLKAAHAKPAAFTVAAGAKASHALLERHPQADALFAASDLLAIGAVRALTERGRRVPEDVSVIGYDDTPLAATYVPALSSVHQNLHEGGVLLARKALALVEGREVASETLPTNLVVRAT
ncbi:LacI family DNA-binding transcriptional regulator [Luteimonas aquatica]|uniref:LacI family DNA-binding transcriptional regulator n=1 Tax=Luteimonas aquatica TaxID=450364 RepID=UPI001F55C9B5|nr:LacI family DNA-binding transcriptional regulator [Luteimonas aquatica]